MAHKVGIDVVEIGRFRHRGASSKQFLERTFTPQELAYCAAFSDPAPHLAGFFAAKEAASKALGTKRHPFLALEIRHRKDGAPEVWQLGKKLQVGVSITHSDTVAAAVAIG